MITRFAPSPTGPLHLGHAYSAIVAHQMAQCAGGTFLLRIEDIDQSRSRSHWEKAIFDDLHWLGLHWPEPVMRQSDRLPAYRDALDHLRRMGLTYACTCTRRDVLNAASAPQEGAAIGPGDPVYPGTCKHAGHDEDGAAIRLHMDRAIARIGPVSYRETGDGVRTVTCTAQEMTDRVGDIVLARRDMGTSYHLSVVVDDAAQNVTCVTRGSDLAQATPIHVLLQRLLELSSPDYHHHRLIRDADGKRLAKRDDARAIAAFRADGATPADLHRLVGLTPPAP